MSCTFAASHIVPGPNLNSAFYHRGRIKRGRTVKEAKPLTVEISLALTKVCFLVTGSDHGTLFCQVQAFVKGQIEVGFHQTYSLVSTA